MNDKPCTCGPDGKPGVLPCPRHNVPIFDPFDPPPDEIVLAKEGTKSDYAIRDRVFSLLEKLDQGVKEKIKTDEEFFKSLMDLCDRWLDESDKMTDSSRGYNTRAITLLACARELNEVLKKWKIHETN